jgi:hypothetical protein
LTPELQEQYQEIEQKRKEYDNACERAEREKTAPPPEDGVELRSTEQLTAELEVQETNLAI